MESSCKNLDNPLSDLKLYRFKFQFEVKSDISFATMPGITLRGGFGHVLRKMVCVMKGVNFQCSQCLLADSCPYSVIFVSPNTGDLPRMREATSRPHPFSIESNLPIPILLTTGETFTLHLKLYEKGIKYLPHFVKGLHVLGEKGIGRGRGKFQISEIVCCDTGKNIINEGGDVDGDTISPCKINNEKDVSRVSIQFISPCRLKYRNMILKKPVFDAIISNIIRKIENISYFYGGNVVKCRELINNGDIQNINCEENVTEWNRTSRYSRSQDTVMPMEGFTGHAVFSGAVSKYYSLLKCAEATGIGKNTSFGFGSVRVEAID